MTQTNRTQAAATTGSDSFRELVETHKRHLYYLALDLTGNHHDAEDLSQEVFIKAHENLDGFRGDSKVGTWLRRIAINTYLNKKRKKALSFMSLFGDIPDRERSASETCSPDSAASHSQTRTLVENGMKVLSPREKSAFVLRHMHELPVKEVAASMNIAQGTVKSLLHRATTKLQNELAFLRPDQM